LGINDWFIEEMLTTPEVGEEHDALREPALCIPDRWPRPVRNGQYEWAPAIGASYSTPERAVTISPIARYVMSYHASETGASEVQTLDLFPTVTLGFNGGWSVSFYSENPIVCNSINHSWRAAWR